ncbi:MAG: hypothetical protein HYW02_06940, partial [Deltaproteobacteria bacterium]|nr:hypothetical protein [Deltaproteobacteria bacterium]
MLKRFAFGLIILLPLFPLILLAGSPVIKQPVPIKNIAGIKPTCGKKVCITVESTENLKKDFPKLSLEGKPSAIMVGPNKKPQRFIPDQIIFKPRDLAHLKTFLKRTNAKILHDGTLALPPQRAGLNNPKIRPKKSGYYLLKIPAFTRPNSKEFAKLMESQLKSANGTYRLNQEGLALTHFILKETARGEKVSPNVIIDSAAQPDVMSFTEEELVDDLFLDAFDFPGVGTPYGVNLQKAWQYIDLLQPSAATANPNTEERDTMVKVAFIDEGFRAVPDLISTDLTLDGWDSEC